MKRNVWVNARSKNLLTVRLTRGKKLNNLIYNSTLHIEKVILLSTLKLPYGLRKVKNGEILVHISDIHPNESGLKCNCTCPNCGSVLQAKLPRNNSDFTPRFAHHNADECQYATETAIHMKAKEIIEEEMKILLPEVIACYRNYCETVSEEVKISFDKVILEKRVNNIIPDIIAFKGEKMLMIEIACTHAIDEMKNDKIKALDISTLEIDLSDVETNFDEEYLRQQILYSTENKYWIYNSYEEEQKKVLKSKYLKSLEEEEQNELRKKRKEKRLEKLEKEKRKRKLERVIEIIDKTNQEKLKLKWEKDFHKNRIWKKATRKVEIDLNNIPKHINIEIPGEIVFGCDRRIWQSYIFYRYVYNKVKIYGKNTYPISVKRIQKNIKENFKDYLISDLVYTKDIDIDIPSLTKVIYDYLKALARFDYLDEMPSGHIYYAKFIIVDLDIREKMRKNQKAPIDAYAKLIVYQNKCFAK
jgi:hypothetical protein